MPKSVSNMNTIENHNAPLVAPEQVKAGEALTNADKAASQLTISEGLAAIIERNQSADAVRLAHRATVAEAIAAYWTTVEETKALAANGDTAAEKVEAANAVIAHKLVDAILANAMTRKEARSTMGAAFGYAESEKTGKPTSKPLEPGNTIAKRVSSVTIAAEYAITGELPDKGGESLHLVGRDKVQAELEDYFKGELTVRAASQRIEQAIKDARVNIPLEINVDKLEALAGKIRTATDKIASDPALAEAYAVLTQVIGAIPFAVPAKD